MGKSHGLAAGNSISWKIGVNGGVNGWNKRHETTGKAGRQGTCEKYMTYLYMVGNEKRWFAVARTATKPENMQGFHEDNMLFIVDEASGVDDPIMEAILGTLSGENNKLLMCGNPTRTSGTFYDAFNADRTLYKCHTVSSDDSPRTNKENIESLIRKYGKESNVVLVRVYGEFPKQDDEIFINISWLEKSIHAELSDDTL